MLVEMGQEAKEVAKRISKSSTSQKDAVLRDLADLLWIERSYVLSNNQIDVESGQNSGLSAALIDRLTFNADRLKGISNDLNSVADLEDPVGNLFDPVEMANGLKVVKKRVPLGVLGVIYESRPNVTVDIAGLAIKSGNAVILRGGSETLSSNRALVKLIHTALEKNGLPANVVQFIDNPDRSLVYEMLQLSDYIDMIIPRGGAKLHQFCRENSRIPVMTGGIGICHLFVDQTAKIDESIEVIRNAKIQRPTVCNALDTVLVHSEIAPSFIPKLVRELEINQVTFRIHPNSLEYIAFDAQKSTQPAEDGDFDREWLSLILGVKTVSSLEDAILHIQSHSTGHSDGILTESHENAFKFLEEVDSAAVYVNASTRFTDGSQLGLGAEVAISTQRLHARGPMGLQELTTYKWVIQGNYNIRP